MKTLSIIIPVYNVRRYITQCLESIEHQLVDKNLYEVIIVNDGTPDDSMEVAAPIIERMRNVIVVNQDNQGLSTARNVGLGKARGSYVWFVDSDDWLLPHAIDNVLSSIKEHQDVDVISSRLLQCFETSGKELPDFNPSVYTLDGKEYLKRHYCQGAVQRFIFKRQFLLDYDLKFYPKLLHEDGLFGLQMLYFAKKIAILKDPVYAYRIRQAGSIMSSITIKSSNDLLFIHKELRKFQEFKVTPEDQKWYQHRIAFVLVDIYEFSKPIINSKEFFNFYNQNWTYLHKESVVLLTKSSYFLLGVRMVLFPVMWIRFKRYMRNHILPPPIQIRSVSQKVKRIFNFASKLKNIILFSFYGIEHGKGLCVHGHIGIRIDKEATIMIGDKCYISSGNDINPLCARDGGFICVEKGAKLFIGDNCGMSSPRIWSHSSIIIGNNVQIGGNCVILDSDCHSLFYMDRRDLKVDVENKKSAPIVIEDDVLVGANSFILKGVKIGARSIIGAGSMVVKSIPADSIVAGNPARVIRNNNNARKIDSLANE